MDPLPLETLRFRATQSVRKDGALEHRSVKLRYYVELPGRRTDLIRINLEDSRPYAAGDKHRYWFYYQPLVVPWPAEESSAGNKEQSPSLTRRFPSIDLIVFSTVRVFVQRMTDAINEFQSIGFEQLELTSRMREAEFSPVRPRITLRRVHREAQVPMLGSAFRFQDMQQPFSFYADSDGVTQHTLQPNLAALMQATGSFTESDRVAANESWTHVTFDNLGAEFDCPESTYRLRVYDQHFDSIDGEHVPGDITFEEAESRQHTAGQLVSLPKFFSYQFQFDRRPRMMSGGYNSEGRPFLTISKSPNVHLMGTINRNTQSDRMTTSLIAAANPRSAQMTRGLNYKDHLPAVVLNDEHGKPIPGGQMEESWPAPANYEFIKSPGQQFFEFQVSLLIGFTPIAGEAFGLYELYTALNYDKDAFGNKLTDTDKWLVAIAAILPFIGFQGLKRGVRFLSKDVFPLLSETLTKSHDAIARLGSV